MVCVHPCCRSLVPKSRPRNPNQITEIATTNTAAAKLVCLASTRYVPSKHRSHSSTHPIAHRRMFTAWRWEVSRWVVSGHVLFETNMCSFVVLSSLFQKTTHFHYLPNLARWSVSMRKRAHRGANPSNFGYSMRMGYSDILQRDDWEFRRFIILQQNRHKHTRTHPQTPLLHRVHYILVLETYGRTGLICEHPFDYHHGNSQDEERHPVPLQHIGWHYLSNATRLMRSQLFSAASLVEY